MIKTKRLILRNWQASDRQHFAEMNADTKVMQFFPKMLTKEESNAQIGRMQAKHEQNGWGAWAVVVKKTGEPFVEISALAGGYIRLNKNSNGTPKPIGFQGYLPI